MTGQKRSQKPHVRLEHAWHRSPKLLRASADPKVGDSAPLMWVAATTWCNENLTDGLIDRYTLASFVRHKKPELVIAKLVEVGALVAAGGDMFAVHDFLDHNPSKEEVERAKAAKKANGQKGGLASGYSRQPEPPPEKGRTKREAESKQVLQQNEASAKLDASDGEANGKRNEAISQLSDLRSQISTGSLSPPQPPEPRAAPVGDATTTILEELRSHPKLASVANASTAGEIAGRLMSGLRLDDVIDSLRALAFDLPAGATESSVRKGIRGYLGRSASYGAQRRDREAAESRIGAVVESPEASRARQAASERIAQGRGL
jgi:hypothetical protein